jgi:formylglycine-generating enzyme required for sulfatase activity
MVLAEVSAAEAAPSEMVYIPAGAFTMGGSAGPPDPMHTVHVPGFYIDKYEVTIDDFLRFAGNMSYGVPEVWHQHGLARPGNVMPAFGLTWLDAVNYARWRNKRLPTEAEWEKAARGPAGLLYPWGNEFDQAKCSVGGNLPAEVGSRGEANTYGCFDMAGNVAEWVSSLYGAYPFNAIDGREDLQAPGQRVLRGGAWNSPNPMVHFRATRRFWSMPDQRFPEAGFRCAQTPSASLSE